MVRPRGILTNRGFSLLRGHRMPGVQLLPFEGTAFTTIWSLELPPTAKLRFGTAAATTFRIEDGIATARDVLLWIEYDVVG